MHNNKVNPLLESANDSEHARDLASHCSATSTTHLHSGVTIHWVCKKQGNVAHHSTGSELRSLCDGVARAVCLRAFMPSVGFPLSAPILMHEGNQATIASVLADRSMPSLKRLDALARALHHEWKLGGRFIPAHAQPKCQLAHVNAKPHEGPTLERLAHQIIGVHFYPAQGTGRCKLGTFDLFCEKEARAPVEQ